MRAVDRLPIAALGLVDIGVGLYLIGVADIEPWVHALAGVLGLLLALPAFAAAITGRLPALADEGMLVNIGVLTFMTMYVAFIPVEPLRRVGLAIVIGAATLAAIGMYLRLFRLTNAPSNPGRHS
jgi:hypothetical protein